MPPERNGWTHSFAGFRYDARTGELWKGQDRNRLSPHVAILLDTLLDHPGELVSRETLRARMWSADTFVDFEHGLTVSVNRLRQVLGDSSRQPTLIETIPRRGYRWLAAVEKMTPASPQPPWNPGAGGDPDADPRDIRRHPRYVAYALILGAIVVGGLEWNRSRNSVDAKGPTAAPSELAAAPVSAGWTDVPPAAFDPYVKGLLLPSSASPSDWRIKVQYLRLAILGNPSHARAHAELARAYTVGARYGFAPIRDSLRDARSEAVEALRIDGGLADAHVAFGDVEFAEWNWAGASSEYEQALRLEPGNERALEGRARLLTYAGHFDEAVKLWNELLERDPVDPRRTFALATTYIHGRRFEEAQAALQRLDAGGPGGFRVPIALAIAYAGKRVCDDALREADRAVALLGRGHDDVSLVAAGWVYATCGRPVDARRMLDRYESPERPVAADPISLAALYGALGDRERGLQLIQRGVDERSPIALVLDVDIMLDTLRADPRFERQASRVRGRRDAVVALLDR